MPKKQKDFNVKVQIWTKEGVLCLVDDFRFAEHDRHSRLFILIGKAIRDIKLPIQVIVQLDPFDIKCPIGFVKVVQLGKIKLSQFWQLTQGFQMFNGSLKEIKDAAGEPEIQEEFLKTFKLFLSKISELELKEAINLMETAKEPNKRVSQFNFYEVILECIQRSLSIIELHPLLFN